MNGTAKTYPREKDFFEKHHEALDQAREMWRSRCDAFLAQHGDEGTSVLGAGIEVDIIPARCRHYRPITVISASSVTRAQGASVWEDSVRDIIAFLGQHGIEAHYNPGRMD
jgi:hypothetical protein